MNNPDVTFHCTRTVQSPEILGISPAKNFHHLTVRIGHRQVGQLVVTDEEAVQLIGPHVLAAANPKLKVAGYSAVDVMASTTPDETGCAVGRAVDALAAVHSGMIT